ncbi:MAG: maleylacetoacetate isomerase [Henriciella sp.]
MKLYSYYRSSTSYRVRIALNIKQLAYNIVPVNLKTGEQHQPPLTDLNPHGTLPVLLTGTTPLVQSLAIIDWIEERYPEPPLIPERDKGASDVRQLCLELYYAIATEIHAPNNLPVLNYLRNELDADDTKIAAWYAKWIGKTFAPIEQKLQSFSWRSPDLPFGQPSLFEIALIPQIYNAQRWQTDLSNYPLLTAIHAYATRLPAFIAAHPDNQPDAPEVK